MCYVPREECRKDGKQGGSPSFCIVPSRYSCVFTTCILGRKTFLRLNQVQHARGGGRKSFISPRVISALEGKSGEKTFLSVPKIGEKNVRKRERDCCNEARFASHISSPFFSLVPFMKLLWAHSRKNILSSAGCYLLDLASVLGICTNPFHLHRGRESGGEFCQEKDLVERAGERE